MKLGSLFDGSGGFPLSGAMCGIEPVWAAEVEPYPIAVTKSRFPNMKHLGDVSKLNGANIEPVDIITFGSPCQDMSVAGKRVGLKHTDNGDDETTRSGLFMEAVRIIKEMRGATNGEYPRYAVWENVPGAFSSNKGEDFRIVLEEFIKIIEPTATMPEVPAKGWAYADCFCGDGWSIAYRVFDAQYWGVPQRRRRIYLVADFGGQRAREILFECEGLRGYFTKGRTPWKDFTAHAERGIGADDREGSCYGFPLGFRPENVRCYEETATTLCNGTRAGFCNGIIALESGIAQREGGHIYEGVSGTVQTLTSRMGTGGGNVPMIMEPFCKEHRASSADDATTWKHAEVANTINVFDQGEARANEIIVMATQQGGAEICENLCHTITAAAGMSGNNQPVISIGNGQANQSITEEQAGALNCMHDQQAVAVPAKPHYIVRRLTPTECARLQGFPDHWGHIEPKTEFTDEEYEFWLNVRNTHAAINGKAVKDYTKAQMLTWYNKLHTDSAEYKLWGNGIALPNALYIMQGITNKGEK